MSLSVGLAIGARPLEPLELALLRAGHRIEWRAHSADEAISLLAERAPDAVLILDDPAFTRADIVGTADLLRVRSVLVHRGAVSAQGARLDVADRIALENDAPPDVSLLDATPAPALSPDAVALGTPAVAEPASPPTPVPAPMTTPATTPEPDPPARREPQSEPEPEPVAPTRIPYHPVETEGEHPEPIPSRVITVWGPTGAPGRTVTATALAAELALRGRRVALVDADTYGGTIAPALGLLDESPGFAAACRLAGSRALSADELTRVSQPLSAESGVPADRLRVLTGIGRPSRWPELSSERVTATLEACREWCDVVVVDAGFNLESDEELSSDIFAPRRNAATIAALRAADRVVAVGAADPLGLARFLRTYPDLVEAVDDIPVQVVITRVRSSILGLDPAGQVRHTLDRFAGIRDAVLVDDDPVAADAALLRALPVPLAAPKSALRTGVARLADALGYAVPRSTGRRSPFAWRRTG